MARRAVIVGLIGLLGTASLAFAASAGPPPTFLGLTISAPFTLAECPLDPELKLHGIYAHTEAPCWMEAGPNYDLFAGTVMLVQEPKASWEPFVFIKPSLSGHEAWAPAAISVMDGRIAAILIYTRGELAQKPTLAALAEKFGKASGHDTRTVQNSMGATFEKWTATWKGAGWRVNFVGMLDSIERGEILVTTPAYDAAIARKDDATPKF